MSRAQAGRITSITTYQDEGERSLLANGWMDVSARRLPMAEISCCTGFCIISEVRARDDCTFGGATLIDL